MRGVRRGPREQVLERAGVVAQHGALADAEAAAALDVDDVAGLERLGAPLDRLAAGVTPRLAPAARSVVDDLPRRGSRARAA